MKKRRLVVISHNIRSCYNVGSIFRTADALGIEKVYLGGYTPRPDQHSSISKTALGAEKFVKWEANWHTHLIIKKLKEEGFKIVALEQTNRSVDIGKYKPTFPLALLLGNEVKGLSKSILAKVDDVVEIPMLGEKESLNVSVAFGIASFRMLNQ